MALTLVTPGAAPPENPGAVVQQLRSIALDVEAGQLVGARSAAVIVEAPDGGLMVYGVGPGDERARLNAAYVLLSLALRELEAVARAAAG